MTARFGDSRAEEQTEPLTPAEQLAAKDAEIARLRAENGRLRALLNDREWLTSRVIKLLNSERRLLVVFAAGALAALLLAGGGLGIKAVYDAFHRPGAVATHVITVRVPAIDEDRGLATPGPEAPPSPSPSGSPIGGAVPVAAVSPRPRSLPPPVSPPPVSPPPPLPSPSASLPPLPSPPPPSPCPSPGDERLLCPPIPPIPSPSPD